MFEGERASISASWRESGGAASPECNNSTWQTPHCAYPPQTLGQRMPARMAAAIKASPSVAVKETLVGLTKTSKSLADAGSGLIKINYPMIPMSQIMFHPPKLLVWANLSGQHVQKGTSYERLSLWAII
jgi:hypothetical protein